MAQFSRRRGLSVQPKRRPATRGEAGDSAFGSGDPMPITGPDGGVERMELRPG
jgi:hypothetical protein